MMVDPMKNRASPYLIQSSAKVEKTLALNFKLTGYLLLIHIVSTSFTDTDDLQQKSFHACDLLLTREVLVNASDIVIQTGRDAGSNPEPRNSRIS